MGGVINLVVLVMVMVMKVQSQEFDLTVFNFSSFNGREEDLTYEGDAHISPYNPTSLSLIQFDHRLLPIRNRVGRVLYSPRIRLWDGAGSRQDTFQTVIRGSIVDPTRSSRPSDGIAFFIAPVNTTFPTNSFGGNLGLYDSSSGFSPAPLYAVELDTFSNPWDPHWPHLGININSRISVARVGLQYRADDTYFEATITYDAPERLITVVTVLPNGRTTRLRHHFDLKTLLPEWVQIGISASTGVQSPAFHVIDIWSFISFMVDDDDDHHTNLSDN